MTSRIEGGSVSFELRLRHSSSSFRGRFHGTMPTTIKPTPMMPRGRGIPAGRGAPPSRRHTSGRRGGPTPLSPSPNCPTWPTGTVCRRSAGSFRGQRRQTGRPADSSRARRPNRLPTSKITAPSSRSPCRHPQVAPARGRLGSAGAGSRAQISRIVGACNEAPQRQATVSPA